MRISALYRHPIKGHGREALQNVTLIRAVFDETTEHVTLTHPDRPTVTLHPETNAQALINWVMPSITQNRANPDTGARDIDTLRVLNILGHQDFGLYAEVIQDGMLAVADELELI